MQMNYEETASIASSSADPPVANEEEYHEDGEEEEEEESRELTHDEIWDDSALIDAWNSAAAEYEVRATTSLAECSTWLMSPLAAGLPWPREEVERRTGQEVPSVRLSPLHLFTTDTHSSPKQLVQRPARYHIQIKRQGKSHRHQ